MLCHAMTCHAMLCSARLRCPLGWYAMLCYGVLCYPGHAMLFCAMVRYSTVSVVCAGLVRPMERPPGTPVSPRLHSREPSPPEVKKNRWASAAQAVMNPTLQKEQSFPSSMGRSHFPRSHTHLPAACRSRQYSIYPVSYACSLVILHETFLAKLPH